MPAVVAELPLWVFATIGYVLGWRIYLDSQKRIDRLIDVIVALCPDLKADEIKRLVQE